MASAGRQTSRRDVVPALLAAAAASLGRAPGAPNAVVLTAPAGTGKSHALREFAGQVGLPVRHVAPAPADSARPFAVADRLFDIEPTGDTSEPYLERLDELVADRSLVLVVDDLQLVDAGSLGVLQDVLALGAPVVLLAAHHPSEERPALAALLRMTSVAQWQLPPFDRIDLDVLVNDVCGAWPSDAVRRVLAPAADNALRLIAAIDGIRARGAISVDGVLELDPAALTPVPPLTEAIEQRLDSLPQEQRVALQGLAVAGRPVPRSALVAITGAADTGAPSALVAAGLLREDGDALDFVHNHYRDVVYATTPDEVRRRLHRAAATAEPGTAGQARHLIAAGTVPESLLDGELDGAPAVTADLIAVAARGTTDMSVAADLAAGRARALSRSGQIRAAAEIATEALTWAADPAAVAELNRVALFTLTAGGRYAEAIDSAHRLLAGPLPDSLRRLLGDHLHFLQLLAGQTPVPTTPIAADPREVTMNGLVAEALRRYLLGDTAVALEYAWAASRRSMPQKVEQNEGMSADLWVPYVVLAHQGPIDALSAWEEVVALRAERDLNWLTAGHEALRATIDLQAGRLEDAAAQFDSALDLATRLDLGGSTNSVATRAFIDVLWGDPAAARTRLDNWARPSEFGLALVDRTRVAILESERRYAPAADLARQVWRRADGLNHRAWQALTAPEFARVALRAADAELLAVIAADLTRFGLDQAPGRPVRLSARIALLLAGPDYAQVGVDAPALATEAQEAGLGMLAMTCREETAVALAATGSKDAARLAARTGIALAEDAGAVAVSARIAGRLRSAGVRLGSAATRVRPTVGWGSLTPTEERIVGLIAAGTPGPQIARQLHLSPRTVQTHVSHVLTKLGLTNRVELAAAAARRDVAAD
jgi:DNA-binding NarL/FixJ family response regulator